jgi:hypothetical protein
MEQQVDEQGLVGSDVMLKELRNLEITYVELVTNEEGEMFRSGTVEETSPLRKRRRVGLRKVGLHFRQIIY